MAAPSVLLSKTWSAGATQVLRLANGTVATQIGGDLDAAADTSVPNHTVFPTNHAIKFNGMVLGLDLSVNTDATIEAYDHFGNNGWASLLTFDAYATISGTANKEACAVSGYYPFSHPDGSDGVFVVGQNGSSTTTTFQVHRSANGVKWVSGDVGTIVSRKFAGFGRGIMHQNKLMIAFNTDDGTAATEWAWINPYNVTHTLVSSVPTGAHDDYLAGQPAYAVFRGDLYMLLTYTHGATARLYRFTGTAWVLATELSGTTITTAGVPVTVGHELFAVGSSKLVAIVRTETSGSTWGTKAFDLELSGGTWTVTDKSDPVIPSGLRSGGGSASQYQRWCAFVDNDTAPGTPTYHLWLLDTASSSTNASRAYTYVDSSTVLTDDGEGPVSSATFTRSVTGGGCYHSTSGDYTVLATDRDAISDGSRVQVVVAGHISTPGRRWYVDGIETGTQTYPYAGVGFGFGGTTLIAGMRILVTSATNSQYQGVWLTSAGTWTRPLDMDSSAEVYGGCFVESRGGSTLGQVYMCTNSGTVTVNTTTETWSLVTTPSAGMFWRANVACATTGNITLSGEQTLDGVLTSASRVAVRAQTAGAENGIYVSAAGAWSRATDFDAVAQGKLIPGAWCYVEGGSTLGGKILELTTTGGITVGSTALTFTTRDPLYLRQYHRSPDSPDMSQGTLFGSASGGSATRSGNAILRVGGDGQEEYTYDWQAGADGYVNGSRALLLERVSTS